MYTRLDYGNFVPVGLLAYQQRHLESVLNAAARLVYRLRRYDHITDALATLRWLRLCRFQYGCHGVSRAARSCSTLLKSADPRRRSAWSLPTSFILVTTTARPAIPSVYCGTSLVSRSSIRSLVGHSVIPSLPVFRQQLKTYLSVNHSPTFYYDIFVRTVHAFVDSVITI